MARLARRVLLGLWLAAALVAWNVIFDAHVRGGAREYVDRQEAYVQGRGPRVDMDAVMRGAVASGLRSATGWTGLVLVPAAVLLLRRRKAGP